MFSVLVGTSATRTGAPRPRHPLHSRLRPGGARTAAGTLAPGSQSSGILGRPWSPAARGVVWRAPPTGWRASQDSTRCAMSPLDQAAVPAAPSTVKSLLVPGARLGTHAGPGAAGCGEEAQTQEGGGEGRKARRSPASQKGCSLGDLRLSHGGGLS